MGLMIEVFRGAHGMDCTNGGISATADTLILMNGDGPFELSERTKARGMKPVKMVPGNISGAGSVKIVPCGDAGEELPGWFMFGGNFAYSSDSRFHELVASLGGPRHGGAVPIHDRQEG